MGFFGSYVFDGTSWHEILCHQDKVSRSHRWTDTDRAIATALTGQPVTLPADERLWSANAALEYRMGHAS